MAWSSTCRGAVSQLARSEITLATRREINRLVARFAIERMAAGYSIECLEKEPDAPNRTVIRRVENSEVVPELSTLIRMGQAVGLRLDWVPPHLQPLLALDEFEVKALIEAADMGLSEWNPGDKFEREAHSALAKLGRVRWRPGVQNAT